MTAPIDLPKAGAARARLVPPAGFTMRLTVFSAAAMALLAVLVLELSLASGRPRLLGLVVAATVAAAAGAMVMLAAQAALAANLTVIRTLRLVGATDGFIARAFVRRFTARALAGAVAGTLVGVGVLMALPLAPAAGALAPVTGFRGWGWAVPVLIPPVLTAVAFAATHFAAFRMLRSLT